jgi:hypothetical protein
MFINILSQQNGGHAQPMPNRLDTPKIGMPNFDLSGKRWKAPHGFDRLPGTITKYRTQGDCQAASIDDIHPRSGRDGGIHVDP